MSSIYKILVFIMFSIYIAAPALAEETQKLDRAAVPEAYSAITMEHMVGRYDFGEHGMASIAIDGERLVFHSEKDALTRKLFASNKYLYVYGADDETKEPAQGSLLFMPHERDDADAPSQILWLHGHEKMAVGSMVDWE